MVAALALWSGWGALYVYRTSFVADGVRVFCLWDDGMISMQYARNLARGEGLVWNAGEPAVQGFSNLGVTLLMAAVHALGLPVRLTALSVQGIALAALVGVVALTWAAARRMAPEHPGVPAAAAVATMAWSSLAVWSLQGSDVAFMALWLVGSVFVLAHPARGSARWPWTVFAVLGGGLLLRVDAFVPYVVLCAAMLRAPSPHRRRNAVIATVVLALGVLGPACWSWMVYGDPLPNTWYLKATGSPRALVWWSGLRQLVDWLPGLVPALAVVGLAAVRGREDQRRVAIAAAVAGTLVYCVAVGGDWAPQRGNRMFAPVLPLVSIGLALGLRPLVERALVDWSPRGRGVALVGVAGGLALLGTPGPASREWLDPGAPTLYRDYNARNHARAQYLRAHTDPDTVVGVYWGGVPIYFSDRPGLDLLGKSDRHIARLKVDRFSPGHSKWDWDYVLHERQPDIIFDPKRGLGQREEFRRDYVLVRREGEDVLWIRRDAMAKLHDPSAELDEASPD